MTRNVDTAERDVLAERLRAEYVYQRRRQGARYRRLPILGRDRYGTIWIKLARIVRKDELDATLFMERAFDACRAYIGRFPYPNQLLSPTLLEQYRQARRSDLVIVTSELGTQQAIFASALIRQRAASKRLGDEEIIGGVLTSPNGLSPLYRHCIAVRLRMMRIARLYFDRSVRQYMARHEAYRQRWARLLPDGYHELAQRRYLQSILGNKEAIRGRKTTTQTERS